MSTDAEPNREPGGVDRATTTVAVTRATTTVGVTRATTTVAVTRAATSGTPPYAESPHAVDLLAAQREQYGGIEDRVRLLRLARRRRRRPSC